MSYQFKGIDITTIVDTTTDPQPTNFADVYRGLPDITPPQYNNSRLLTNPIRVCLRDSISSTVGIL